MPKNQRIKGSSVFITVCKRSCGKVMFSQASVCIQVGQEVHQMHRGIGHIGSSGHQTLGSTPTPTSDLGTYPYPSPGVTSGGEFGPSVKNSTGVTNLDSTVVNIMRKISYVYCACRLYYYFRGPDHSPIKLNSYSWSRKFLQFLNAEISKILLQL